MSKTSLSFAIFAALVAGPIVLHADTYSYIINAAAANGDPSYNFTASGTMTGPVDPYNSAGVDVTAITGSANGYNFQGVVDPGATDSQTIRTEYGYSFDNVLYPASDTPHTDTAGFLLYLDGPLGTSLAHVYYTGVTSENPGGYQVDVVDPNEPGASTPFGVATPFSVRRFSIARASAPSAVPEPSTFWLLATGMACLAGMAVRHSYGSAGTSA
jgi:hypothetical protein